MERYINRATQSDTIRLSRNDRERDIEGYDLSKPPREALDLRSQDHIAVTPSYRSTIAPIDRLPDELLSDIFSLVVEEIDFFHLKRLVKLMLVSKGWSKIVLETPSLWAYARSDHACRAYETAILRSKESPLRVVCKEKGNLKHFMQSALQEAYRWKSAEFHLEHDVSLYVIDSLNNISAPIMTELKVYCREVFGGRSFDIFSGGAPRLRHLTLVNIRVPWGSTLFSQLEVLFFTSSSIIGPSTEELADILQRCPNLLTFELERNPPRNVTTLANVLSSNLEPVHLPLLNSFKIDVSDACALSDILSCVHMPACTNLTVTCRGGTEGNQVFSDRTRGLALLLSSLLQSAPTLGVYLSSECLILSFEGDSRVKICLLDHMSPWNELTSLTWMVILPPITITVLCSGMLFGQAAQSLHSIPSVASLTLIGDSDHYITFLSDPTLKDGIYRWVLPNLTELVLEGCGDNDPQLLMDLAGKRSGRGGFAWRRDGELGPPTRLRKLRVVMTDGTGRRCYDGLRAYRGDNWAGDLIDQ
ncbi:hypothetical protein FRB97_005766 [Tulasnella sp. 331]|nr:hypothetical protein FRB97_005766 [Tulasnella sp. 331]